MLIAYPKVLGDCEVIFRMERLRDAARVIKDREKLMKWISNHQASVQVTFSSSCYRIENYVLWIVLLLSIPILALIPLWGFIILPTEAPTLENKVLRRWMCVKKWFRLELTLFDIVCLI